MKTKKINLALQGGGAHGAFAWGVLDKILEDKRLEIDGISATSAGAMNAGVLASVYAKEGPEGARKALHHFWKLISKKSKIYSVTQQTLADEFLTHLGFLNTPSYMMFEMLTGIMSPYQFNISNFNPLKEVLEQSIDFETLRTQNKIKVRVCATNVKTGKAKIFGNDELCIDALLASACLPFLFQAVEVQEEYYWDGGYIGNPALFPLIYDTTTPDILVVHINPLHREKVPHTSSEIRDRVNEISFNSSLVREMRAISFVTRLIDEKWIKDEFKDKIQRKYIHAIRADEIMKNFGVPSKMNADWEFLCMLKKLGYNQANQWIDQNFDSIGRESTVDLIADYF